MRSRTSVSVARLGSRGEHAAVEVRLLQDHAHAVEAATVALRPIELPEAALGANAFLDRQPAQPGDVPRTYADISKAQKLLGYHPRVKIEDGIPKFVDWFRQNQ